MPIELPSDILDPVKKPESQTGVSGVCNQIQERTKGIQMHSGAPSGFDINNNPKYLAAIAYLETDPNASQIWNALREEEREHIKGLIARTIHKNKDPQTYMIYGALDTIMQAGQKITEIENLWMLYRMSHNINTENDIKKSIVQYVEDFILVLGEAYSIKNENEKQLFRGELTDIITKNYNNKLHEPIMNLLQEYRINFTLPKNRQGNSIRISKIYLAGLNTTQPTREIGKLNSTNFPYTIHALQNKAEMVKESKELGHCIGESDYYIERVLGGKILIFSLRDTHGKPYWTIDYNIGDRSIVQFRGGGEVAVNSLPENEELVMRTLDTITQAGYPVERINESFNYPILRDLSSTIHESSATDTLKEKCLSGKYQVLKGELKLNAQDTVSDVLKLTQIGGLRLNLTGVSQDIKDQITEVRGGLIDTSESVSYRNLTNIGGNMHFHHLESAEGLESLTSIGGSAEFNYLDSAKGLENLTNIGGSVSFHCLESAEGLESLTSIGGNAGFWSLTSAEGLENLTNIGGNAGFKKIKTAKGLESLTSIGRSAEFHRLKTAKGLENLTNIGGNAEFHSLNIAKGLENLTSIGGDMDFICLESAEGLENLTSIGGKAYFNGLPMIEKQKIPALRVRNT